MDISSMSYMLIWITKTTRGLVALSNTTGAVIDCNKSNVTFHVNGNEHRVQLSKKQPQVYSINYIGKFSTITIGGFEFPIPTVNKKYDILIVGDVHIPIEVT